MIPARKVRGAIARIVPLRTEVMDQLVLEGRATAAAGDLLDLAAELGLPAEAANSTGRWPDRVSATLLRTDAVHLAAALAIGPDLGVLLTCDDRLRAAALSQGLEVESPS